MSEQWLTIDFGAFVNELHKREESRRALWLRQSGMLDRWRGAAQPKFVPLRGWNV